MRMLAFDAKKVKCDCPVQHACVLNSYRFFLACLLLKLL